MTHRRRLSGPSPDRWLISYADFITLLFAFFVVLYGVAQNDREKPRDVAASVKRAFAGAARFARHTPAAAKPAISRAAPTAIAPGTPGELAPAYAQLKQQLRQEMAEGKMQVTMDARGIIVSLHEKSFFPSGGDIVYPSAFDSLAKVAAIIHDLPNAVLLEGHTDSVPIHNQRFRSNWDLSAARSIAVLQFFETRYGIAPQRFAIAGYADNLPVAGNDSDEGRSKNRRVDIVIVGATAGH
jgi:chemotaxis protein MotB